MKLRGHIKQWLYGAAGRFNYFGTRVYFPKHSHVFERACDTGVYEKENLRLIAALVQTDTCYIDVGANIGLLSVPILRLHPTCSVISLEPSPNALPFLERTRRESSFGDRWRVIGKAAGSKSGELDFFMHDAKQGAFDSLQETGRAGASIRQTVPVTTLDTEWQAAGSPAVSVIKIDVEGAELNALRGATECIQAHRPAILLEWSGANLGAFNCAPQNLFEFASGLGYAVFSLPELDHMDSALHLELKMLRTESYLLAPDLPARGWSVHYTQFRGLKD